MTRVTLSRELAFAAGQTAADIRMHKAGRTAWNDDERDLAVAKTNRLLLYVPFEQGGLGGLALTPSMLTDLGLTPEDVAKAGEHVAGHNGGPAFVAA